jgi:hypothetical protein
MKFLIPRYRPRSDRHVTGHFASTPFEHVLVDDYVVSQYNAEYKERRLRAEIKRFSIADPIIIELNFSLDHRSHFPVSINLLTSCITGSERGDAVDVRDGFGPVVFCRD